MRGKLFTPRSASVYITVITAALDFIDDRVSV